MREWRLEAADIILLPLLFMRCGRKRRQRSIAGLLHPIDSSDGSQGKGYILKLEKKEEAGRKLKAF